LMTSPTRGWKRWALSPWQEVGVRFRTRIITRMTLLWRWLSAQFGKLLLTRAYLVAIAKEWMNILFGETILAVIFLIWWALGSPPLILIFVSAALVAGYYAWRADHVRLIPKLEFGDVRVVQTPTTIIPFGQPGPNRVVAQILVSSLTTMTDCRGYLRRVWLWAGNDWVPTPVDESLNLLWSTIDQPTRTLYAGIAERLTIFRIDEVVPRYIHPLADIVQQRMIQWFQAHANANDTFKFDISVTATDSPPMDISLKVQMRPQWDDPLIEPL
jgi:hypothetical protein